jgi:Spy/CpxP family protein refolding chaperone
MKKLFPFFLLLLFCVPPLLAQDSYSEFERGLDLTESQRAQVQGIRNKYISEWKAVRRESVRKRLELKELGKNPTANIERTEKLQNEVRELETARDNIYHQYRSEVSKTLNEKQRERYNNFFDTEDRRMEMMGPHQPRRYDR